MKPVVFRKRLERGDDNQYKTENYGRNLFSKLKYQDLHSEDIYSRLQCHVPFTMALCVSGFGVSWIV